MEVLIGIHAILHARGYHILLEAVEDVTAPEAYIGLVRSRHVDGLIVSGPRSDDRQLRDLEAEGFPVVLLGQMPESNLCQIDVDHQRALRAQPSTICSTVVISGSPLLVRDLRSTRRRKLA